MLSLIPTLIYIFAILLAFLTVLKGKNHTSHIAHTSSFSSSNNYSIIEYQKRQSDYYDNSAIQHNASVEESSRIEIDSYNSVPEYNPSTGFPMIDGSGVDIMGNPAGSNLSDHNNSHNSYY